MPEINIGREGTSGQIRNESPREKNMINSPLIPNIKIIFTLFHINAGHKKQLAKAIDKEDEYCL